MKHKDPLVIAGHTFQSRFILGSGKVSNDKMATIIQAGGVELATVALRRAYSPSEENITEFFPKHIQIMPNTSGARTAEEALRIAKLSKHIGCSPFIKIEVIRDSKYLLPDNYETLKAIELIAKEGLIPLPYMYPDLNVARSMADAGAAAIMPLGAPIGSNRGLLTKDFIQILVDEIDLPIIVDAGIGKPSQACEAMEMGVDAIMANTAISSSGDIASMALAFKLAIEAGRLGYLAKFGFVDYQAANASSPLTGFLE